MSSPARLSRVVAAHDPHVACDFIAQYAELSKSRVKDAMNKGAVWLTRAGRGRQRLRRATAELKNGDRVELFYDEQILSRIPADRRDLPEPLSRLTLGLANTFKVTCG